MLSSSLTDWVIDLMDFMLLVSSSSVIDLILLESSSTSSLTFSKSSFNDLMLFTSSSTSFSVTLGLWTKISTPELSAMEAVSVTSTISMSGVSATATELWLSLRSFSTASIFSMNCSVSLSISPPAPSSPCSLVLGFMASVLISLLGSKMHLIQFMEQ